MAEAASSKVHGDLEVTRKIKVRDVEISGSLTGPGIAARSGTGVGSVVEGTGTIASGNNAHAEGLNSQATGENSHAQNEGTIAQGKNQTVVGKYNLPQGHPTNPVDTDYAFIIGNGTGTNNRSNATVVTWEGEIQTRKDVVLLSGERLSDRAPKASPTFTGVSEFEWMKSTTGVGSVTFNPGDVTKTITHNLGHTNYRATIGSDSFSRHVRRVLNNNTLVIELDDPSDETIVVDYIIVLV